MRAALSAFAIVLAVTSCTGATDYDVLDDSNETSTDPTVAATHPRDSGASATTSRGTDAGTVAQRPDAVAPPPAPAPPPPVTPPPEKKKGKHHDDD